MGVLNLTPDSFADNGRGLEAPEALVKAQNLVAAGSEILDLGAESSAPFNSAIAPEEEIKRFEHFFSLPAVLPFLSGLPRISIDSYRPETVAWVTEKLRAIGHQGEIWWNDVSGVVDQAVLDFLAKDSRHFYVLCHNLCGERQLTLKHMNFVQEIAGDQFSRSVEVFFQQKLALLSAFHSQIIIDPCFGFSKSREQNYQLMQNLLWLAESFKEFPLLIGVSKKSFLQALAQEKDRDLALLKSEWFHFALLVQWMSALKGRVIFRVHDPSITVLAKNFVSMLSFPNI